MIVLDHETDARLVSIMREKKILTGGQLKSGTRAFFSGQQARMNALGWFSFVFEANHPPSGKGEGLKNTDVFEANHPPSGKGEGLKNTDKKELNGLIQDLSGESYLVDKEEKLKESLEQMQNWSPERQVLARNHVIRAIDVLKEWCLTWTEVETTGRGTVSEENKAELENDEELSVETSGAENG